MKRRIEPYSFYDHTGIAAHLEDMAARLDAQERRGLHLEL